LSVSFQPGDLVERLVSAEIPDPAPENLERLAGLLRSLDGKVEVAEGLLTGDAIGTFLRSGDRSERPRDRVDLEELEALRKRQNAED